MSQIWNMLLSNRMIGITQGGDLYQFRISGGECSLGRLSSALKITSMIKNLGNADLIMRLIFSIVVLITFFAGIISGPIAVGLLVLSAILLVTVFFQFCPVYAVLRFSTSFNHQSRNVYRRRLLRFLSAIGLIVMVHHFIARPWFLDWGAPEKIQALALPGDYFTDGNYHTRAVLVNAQPNQIWPWIMQLGQERGGFYSYTILENAFLAEMKNVYGLQADLQQPRNVGDTIWLATRKNYNGNGYQILAQVIPNQSFVMTSEHTWLIARSSGSKDVPKGNLLLRYLTFEVPHFIMEQKMLRTIKQLSEK